MDTIASGPQLATVVTIDATMGPTMYPTATSASRIAATNNRAFISVSSARVRLGDTGSGQPQFRLEKISLHIIHLKVLYVK